MMRRHNKVANNPAQLRFGPILTPISMVKTATQPAGKTMGISTNTAGRLSSDSSQGIAMMAVKSFEGEFRSPPLPSATW